MCVYVEVWSIFSILVLFFVNFFSSVYVHKNIKTLKLGKVSNVQIRLIDSNLLEISVPPVADELVASDVYTLYGLDYDSPKFSRLFCKFVYSC